MVNQIRPRGPAIAMLMGSVVLIVIIVAGLLWYLAQSSTQRAIKKYQDMMSLTPIDSPVKQAPNFSLTDQNDKTISLESLKGKVIVIEFMDPVCKDICPIVSQEIVGANALLGGKAQNVVFLAVNVNQFHESKSDVMAFSKEQGLNKLPNWHFLTGTTAQLQAVWKAYGVEVIPNPTGDVQHSSLMFFVKKDGTEAYVANPDNSKSSIQQWGHGIQTVVTSIL